MNINKIFSERDTRLKILDTLKFVPDKMMLKLEYFLKTNKRLNLKNPTLFNEKMQWLKLNDRKKSYTTLVDKYEVRDIVKEKIGEKYLVPLYGVWDNVEDICFDQLPESFVLKCTHDSGSVILCQDKNKLDIEKSKKMLNCRMQKNAFWWAREWPYKNVKPRIIAEKYMIEGKTPYLPVYKFFCFNGEPKVIQQIQNDKQIDESVDYFDTEWNILDIKQRFPNSKMPMPKPARLKEMLDIARKMSEGMCFLRVDLYIINDEIYFSENTFYPDAGYSIFEPNKWDEIMGRWITLPVK